MHDIKEITRTRMVKFYPRALVMALGHYRRIAQTEEKLYPDFKKQQEACKVSIAHIQLLLKLGRELIEEHKVQDDGAVAQEDLRSLIEKAQEEISGHKKDV